MTKSRKSRNTVNTTHVSGKRQYIGRFAPSPTGPLHLGSLTCALAGFLDARSQGGQWLMRMEDLDPPREVKGAANSILESLQAHGLCWDGPVLWQSQRHDAYRSAIDSLLLQRKAFRCDCSRSRLRTEGNIYRGYCRERQLTPGAVSAIRVIVKDHFPIAVDDRIQATLTQDVENEVGDFVVLRRDGLFAYQLAVVVDDAYQSVNQVVRGSDLYDSTPRQIYLQEQLGLATPGYAHIPVLTNNLGQKLSKQTHAPALDNSAALDNLKLALRLLRQPPPSPECQQVERLLQEAIANWHMNLLPSTGEIPQSTLLSC